MRKSDKEETVDKSCQEKLATECRRYHDVAACAAVRVASKVDEGNSRSRAGHKL